MNQLHDRVALVTGASKGIGPHIARALAGEGMRLVLVARPSPELRFIAAELRGPKTPVLDLPADVTDREAMAGVLRRAAADWGGVDVLVNNAGIEDTAPFHQLDPGAVARLVAVNLTAPLLLAQMVLPGMLSRGSGHIVNVSSLAGRAGPAYAGPYAATKAGLVAFTQSLRAEYRSRGVSASVICPGFIRGAGLHHRHREQAGLAEPRLLGTSTPQEVARAVVRAIRRDLPDVIVNPTPVRPLLALGQLFPSLAGVVMDRAGVTALFRQGAAARRREMG